MTNERIEAMRRGDMLDVLGTLALGRATPDLDDAFLAAADCVRRWGLRAIAGDPLAAGLVGILDKWPVGGTWFGMEAPGEADGGIHEVLWTGKREEGGYEYGTAYPLWPEAPDRVECFGFRYTHDWNGCHVDEDEWPEGLDGQSVYEAQKRAEAALLLTAASRAALDAAGEPLPDPAACPELPGWDGDWRNFAYAEERAVRDLEKRPGGEHHWFERSVSIALENLRGVATTRDLGRAWRYGSTCYVSTEMAADSRAIVHDMGIAVTRMRELLCVDPVTGERNVVTTSRAALEEAQRVAVRYLDAYCIPLDETAGVPAGLRVPMPG